MEQVVNKKPRFSVVIPTYSAAVLLMKCIRSLCDQTRPHDAFEIIVVNDGGKRDIGREIELLDCQIPLTYVYQENKGPASARNTGIKKAKGEIILFLDDDSLPTSNWLQATCDAWNQYPDFDGIGGYVKKDISDSLCCQTNTDFFNWYLRASSHKKDTVFLATCNAGYKKEALINIGNFDEGFKGASGEDRDLNIKILRNGGKLMLDDKILVYHDKDLTFRTFLKKHYNYGKVAKKIYNRYPNQSRISSDGYTALYKDILGNYKTVKDRMSAFFFLILSQVLTTIGYQTAVLCKQY